jgi:3-carboxy-cis,cis-muconate cycloisomerase
LVEQACQQAVAEQKHLKTVLAEMDQVNTYFNEQALQALFNPTSYLGNIQAQIDAVLQAAQEDQRS